MISGGRLTHMWAQREASKQASRQQACGREWLPGVARRGASHRFQQQAAVTREGKGEPREGPDLVHNDARRAFWVVAVEHGKAGAQRAGIQVLQCEPCTRVAAAGAAQHKHEVRHARDCLTLHPGCQGPEAMSRRAVVVHTKELPAKKWRLAGMAAPLPEAQAGVSRAVWKMLEG
jgi:hypothetical protein